MEYDDEAERDRRGDEELREKDWQLFIEHVISFAETEKFSGVLAAVARAMRDKERDDRS